MRKFALRKFAIEFAGVKSVLMKGAWMIGVASLFLTASLAHAQQFDVGVGGSTLFSTRNTSASLAFLPPSERGGLYPNASIERTFKNHFGYSAEIAFRYKRYLYNDYQPVRPILYDFNGVYVSRLNSIFPGRIAKKTQIEFTGGVGGESVLFYTQYGTCGFSACSGSVNGNHFLVHAGAEVRYMLYHRLFIRPEANLYHIFDNSEFHSDNVLRLGATIGITFHRD